MTSDPPKLRGALIGCGYFAQFHIAAWRRIPCVKIVAACDPRIDNARAISDLCFERAEDLLSSVALDFVDIVSRPETHADLVKLAADHGVDVICQKPMAPDLKSARLMAETARQAGIRLMIHDNWRWQAWYRKVAALIRSGSIGQPLTYGFRTRRRDGNGPLPYAVQPYFRMMPRMIIYEVMVHHIDVARFLFGDIASLTATARKRNPMIAGEDQALIALRHKSEVDGWIDGHRMTDTYPDGPVMGDAFFDGEDGVLVVSAAGDVFRNNEIAWKNDVVTGYRGDSVYNTQVHFVECLQSGAPFETSAEDYLKTYEAMEAAYTSIKEERPVSL